MKKIFSIFLILCLLLPVFSTTVFAAPTASATVSSSTVYVGETVTVTFTFKADKPIGAAEPRITYNSKTFTFEKLTSGGTGNAKGGTISISYFDQNGVGVDTYEIKAVFKAVAVGDCTFSVNFPSLGLHTAESEYLGSPEKSISVSVKEENKSSNANLKWLTVPSGCTLVPKFSKNVTEYTCTVPYSITKFPMDWETEDKDAKDSVTPLQTLKVGKNTRTVTVTAPDGTKKAYTVTVIREEAKETPVPSTTPTQEPSATPSAEPTPTGLPVTVFINDKQYTLASTITLELPENFIKEKYIHSSNEIESAVLGNLRLVQLFDGERDGLFIFDSKTNSFKPYNSVKINENTLTVLDERPEIAKGLLEKHVIINDGEYTGWASEKLGEGYYILNVVNNLGENYAALYCVDDGSIQKLSPAIASLLSSGVMITPTEAPHVKKDFSIDPIYIGIGACILILIAIIVVIILLIVKSSKKPPKPKRDWGLEDNDPYNISIDRDEPEEDNEDFE